MGFLGLGMLLGSDGPGGIAFDDAELARAIGVVALVAILFEGGLTTSWREVRRVVPSAAVLATAGVAITAGITGLGAYLVFDLSLTTALLLGAVIASTDAAAVFLVLRTSTLRRRLAGLLELESGTNDPMAVALTLGLIALLTVDGYRPADIIGSLVLELAVGTIVGLLLGMVAAWGVNRIPRAILPFTPVASVGLAALSFGAADVLGGSGFIAVYIVGLRLGNTPSPFRSAIVTVHQGLAYLAQIALFVTLGLLVFPSDLATVVLPALAIAAVLILLARPLAVLLCLAGQGFTSREKLLVSWAGLRGAVPIVLATFPPTEGVAGSATIFNTVFFVVLASALIQGPTIEPLARRLGLTSEESAIPRVPREVGAIPGADFIEFSVTPTDAIAGRLVRDSGLPRSALVSVIVRAGSALPPRGSTRIEARDRLYLVVRAGERAEIEQLLELWEHGPLPAHDVEAEAHTESPPDAPAAQDPHPVIQTTDGTAVTVAGHGDASVAIGLERERARVAEAVLSSGAALELGATLAGVDASRLRPAHHEGDTREHVRWETLPGVGRRLRVRGASGRGVTVVQGRLSQRHELYVPDDQGQQHVAALSEDEARALGAALIATATERPWSALREQRRRRRPGPS